MQIGIQPLSGWRVLSVHDHRLFCVAELTKENSHACRLPNKLIGKKHKPVSVVPVTVHTLPLVGLSQEKTFSATVSEAINLTVVTSLIFQDPTAGDILKQCHSVRFKKSENFVKKNHQECTFSSKSFFLAFVAVFLILDY